MTGFVIGSLIGTAYRKWADPDASTALMHRLWIPLAVTIVASQGFYAAFKGHLKTVEAATTTPRRLAD